MENDDITRGSAASEGEGNGARETRDPSLVEGAVNQGPLAPVSGEDMAAAIRELQEQLDAHVNFAGLSGLDDADITSALVSVERLAWQVQSLQVGLAYQAYDRSVSRPKGESLSFKHGCATPTEYLQRTTLISRAEAGRRMRLARSVSEDISLTAAHIPPRFPYVAQAVCTSAIPMESARTISNTLFKVHWANAKVLEIAEKNLVEAATGLDLETGTLQQLLEDEEKRDAPNLLKDHSERGLLDPLEGGEETPAPQADPSLAQNGDSLRTLCGVWSQFIDQDGTLPKDKDVLAARGIHLGQASGGLVPVRGRLLPEVAAAFSNLCDAINAPRNQRPKDAVEAQQGEGEEASLKSEAFVERWAPRGGNEIDPDGRSPDNKRHDAFAAILGVAAASSEVPDHGGAPVTVLVQTTEEALTDNGGAWLHGPGGNVSLLSPQATRHAACAGALQCYAQNASGRLVALGNKQRVFTAHQRRAIVARDGGCVIPGCSTPPAWCEIHHVLPHTHGGETHVDNGVALCWFHHRSIETSGWGIRTEKGVPQVRAPGWLDHKRQWRSVRPRNMPPDGSG